MSRLVRARNSQDHVTSSLFTPIQKNLLLGVLDALLLRIIPTILYGAVFYPLIGLRGGASHVALYFVVMAVFAATAGMLSMAVTICELGTHFRSSRPSFRTIPLYSRCKTPAQTDILRCRHYRACSAAHTRCLTQLKAQVLSVYVP